MSIPKKPDAAKLVVGFFTNHQSVEMELKNKLTNIFGSIERESEWLQFDYTDYYQKEMGEGLHRKLLSFEKMISQEELGLIKVKTNEIEKEYEQGGNRSVNLDPGYLLRERFVLATGKNYAHRIYIGHHIYADLTLLYQDGAFVSLPWTYPDYQSPEIQHFLKQVREDYVKAIKDKKK